MKQHKHAECSGFLEQKKQAKMHCLQDPSQSNGEHLNNERPEASRYFRKKKAYLKAKIEEIGTNSKIKNIMDLYGGINDFKKSNQIRTNIVNDEECDLFLVSHSILARCSNHFSQLFNLHGVSNVRQTEICTYS